MPVNVVCRACGVKFSKPPSAAKTARYCSRRCKAQVQLVIARGQRHYAHNPRAAIVGQTFGNWHVIEYSHRIETRINPRHGWRVRCTNCGAERVTEVGAIRRHANNPGCTICCLLSKGEAGFNLLYYNYSHNALRKNRDFLLSPEEFRLLTSSNCHYCGTPPIQISIAKAQGKRAKSPWGSYEHNGIDRLADQFGYTLDNCVPCCAICNFAKGSMPYETFVAHIKMLAVNAKADAIPCLDV